MTTDKQKTKKKEKITTVSVEKIDLCLEMLKSADATDLNQAESETTKELEGDYLHTLLYNVMYIHTISRDTVIFWKTTVMRHVHNFVCYLM